MTRGNIISTAKHRLRFHRWMPYLVFKCQFPTCCNFFTSLEGRSRMYCMVSHYANPSRIHRREANFTDSRSSKSI